MGEQWKPIKVANLNLQPVTTEPGDVVFFDSFVPHTSKPNFTALPRRVLYLTYNLAGERDPRSRYFADKHASFSPDIDRSADARHADPAPKAEAGSKAKPVGAQAEEYW